MDSSRDGRGRIQPSASSSGEQTPNPQLSAANISAKPSPNNAQGETLAQNEANEKARSRSRRFSRGRKRPEDKSISSTVGNTNQTDALNQSSLNNFQDDATDETGLRQNGTRKRRKRRPRTRREDGIKSDGTASPQNGPQDDATRTESGNHATIRQQEQRRPQEIPKANKNVAVNGIDNSLSKDGSPDDVRATGEESRTQDSGRVQKQGQRGSQKRSEQKVTTAKESEQKKLSQGNLQDGATGVVGAGEASEKQNVKSRRRNRRATSKSVDAVTSNVDTSQRGLQNNRAGEEKGSQDGIQSQEQRHLKKGPEANKSIAIKGNELPPKGLQTDATGKEGRSQDGTSKQGQRDPQNQTNKTVAEEREEKKLTQNDPLSEIKKQETSLRRNRRTSAKSVVTSNVSTLSKSALLNSTMTDESRSQDEIPKQGQRDLQNTSETNQTLAAKGEEKKLSQNGHADGATRDLEEPGRQDKMKKQGVRGDQNKVETDKSGVVNSQGKKLPQNGKPNGTATGEGGSQDNTRKEGQKRTRNGRKANNKVLVESDSSMSQTVLQDGATGVESVSQEGTRKRNPREGRARAEDDKDIAVHDIKNNPSLNNDTPNDMTAGETGIQIGVSHTQKRKSDTLDVNNNSSQSDMQARTTENETTEKSVPKEDSRSNKRKAKKQKQKTGSQLKTQSLDAIRNLLNESPEEIVNWLILEQSSLFGKKQQKRRDEVVTLLVKLLAKACDCKCHSGLGNLFSVLSRSWFLTRRVGPILDQLAAKKKSQTKHFNLETIRDLAKVLKEVLNRFPKASAHLPIVKLHSSTMKLASSGKHVDKEIISTVQELMRLRKKGEVTQCTQEAVRRSRPVRTAITDDNSEPPENFRVLSIIPTREDIIAQQDQDQEPFLRRNKIHGRYHNEGHYLDVQFRLLREDFLRPLRVGIQQLMARDSDSDSRDDRLQDVRIYENVRILYPACTSNGVAYKIKFDIASFQRVQWENSKRLIFGSLLCLSKDNFMSFAFATVANRELNNIRKGEIEVRFMSPASEAGLRTGDLCQMVESIAFFEAYRPVLEGLKMMPPGEFPLQRYIVKCQVDVQPPAYLTKGDGQHVVYDFSAILSEEESCDHTSSSVCLPERKNNCGSKASGSMVSVLYPASWPSAKDLELDESQFQALHLALTKEFAVIQGPPGTGKTYIGLKIAKVLLHNISAWNKTGTPILVVCYTNHALDQFLEGIHAFHPDGIVRVGGRSKSETIQECSLSKLKDDMMKQRKMPAHLRQAYGAIKSEMKSLSEMIEFQDGMLDELTRSVFHEDELADYSMTRKHYDSLTRGTAHGTAGKDRRESVIPQWLGLPVQPTDPYQEGFSQPLVMFPFNAECGGMEYFSQADLALISARVQIAPGADGIEGGSLELAGTYDSFIEIPNLWGGFADAGRSITLLAFIFPTGSCGPIVSYDIYGFGFQLWHDGFYGEMGMLTASFVRRDLMERAPPLRAPVLNMNEWNFIGASYDHDSGVARLWHNGNEVAAVSIGKNFDLATQFYIRIGAVASPWHRYYFAGRISHLHIYAEALTVDNIRAVGGIQQGRYKLSQEHLNVDSDEEDDEINDDREEDHANKGKPRDFDFDADVMQDQRILDTDPVMRFESNPSSDHFLSTDDPYETPSFTEGDVQNGSWQFQNPKRIKQKIKRIIQRELNRDDAMSEEEATKVEDVWNLSEKDRWRLYRRWVCDARQTCYEAISDFQEMFDEKVDELKEVRKQQEYEILKNADVIGMTTTGAARYHSLLQDIQPAITIVEEAAEVLEAHIVTSLTPGCQHLILIGDHQQLRPNPTVYDLQKNYDLGVSLFERMVTNGMLFSRLCLQHRMRPQIAKMLDHIYVEPKLQNHESVLNFEDIKGVERNLFFVDHNEGENFISEGKSRSNDHEAKFLTALCRYFIQQGYLREQITILTAYSGQLLKLRREMSAEKTFFEGVRVTAVDNFQGEENDIILLSLVRSDSIGFLKIANRVCVALSRARKGFYIIGNATLLEGQDPDLWKKIIADMRAQGNLGHHLKLVCENHPQNEIQASCAEDFEDAPEGGCKEPCAMKLDCGHDCDQYCHPADLEHKERFACQKPCTKTCNFGHNCRRTCGEECGPCMVRVLKIIPECNHEQQIPCSVDPAKFKCMEMVPKQASPCGHVNQVPCSVAPSDIACQKPCGKLECGHACLGSCDRCQGGRLHLPCDSNCSRTLFCGHVCQDACVRTCPPCSAPCSNYCDHQQCRRNCGYPCETCADDCTWQCPHQKCTVPCGEICNRPRCDEPCPKKLSRCGHSCVGVCGEVCPKLCRVCDKDKFSEGEPGAMFVELLDCGHVFEVKMLDRYMDEADVESGNDREDVEIKHKLCPIATCSIPILYGRRYGNIIKKIVAGFEAVKRRTFLSDVASIVQIQRIRKEVREIKGIQKEVLEKIDQSVTSGRLTSEEVNSCQNQVTFLKFLGNLITKHKITKETSSELCCKINIITSRIMRRRDCFSEQELKEFQEELSRTELLVCFKGLMTALESKSVTLGPEDESSVDSIRSALDSGEALAHQRRKDFMADINRIKQRHGLSKVVETTDCGAELKDMIVKSTNLTQGPWYKCSKAHVYCAAESTEEAGSIKCPECLAESRRTAQSQPEAVPTPMKLSQLMNMTFKHGFVTPGAKGKRRKRPGKKTSKARE